MIYQSFLAATLLHTGRSASNTKGRPDGIASSRWDAFNNYDMSFKRVVKDINRGVEDMTAAVRSLRNALWESALVIMQERESEPVCEFTIYDFKEEIQQEVTEQGKKEINRTLLDRKVFVEHAGTNKELKWENVSGWHGVILGRLNNIFHEAPYTFHLEGSKYENGKERRCRTAEEWPMSRREIDDKKCCKEGYRFMNVTDHKTIRVYEYYEEDGKEYFAGKEIVFTFFPVEDGGERPEQIIAEYIMKLYQCLCLHQISGDELLEWKREQSARLQKIPCMYLHLLFMYVDPLNFSQANPNDLMGLMPANLDMVSKKVTPKRTERDLRKIECEIGYELEKQRNKKTLAEILAENEK